MKSHNWSFETDEKSFWPDSGCWVCCGCDMRIIGHSEDGEPSFNRDELIGQSSHNIMYFVDCEIQQIYGLLNA